MRNIDFKIVGNGLKYKNTGVKKIRREASINIISDALRVSEDNGCLTSIRLPKMVIMNSYHVSTP